MKAEMIQDVYPLSPLQQGMLYHSLSARQPGVDIEQILCTLREELNVAAFGRAWQRAAQRHEILRTSFRWEGLPEPRQEVHRSVHVPLQQKDWRGLSPPEVAARLEDFLNADRQRGCDLTAAPLMRLTLLRTCETTLQLIWTFHHLLLDGRAVVLLLNEIFALTEVFSRGEDLELTPPRPYRAYIDWLQRLDLSQAEPFWREHLKGFTAATPLVVGKSAGDEAVGEVRGEQQVRLSEAVAATLKSIAQRHRLTLNTLLQGAWALLLSRYSGEEDVVFGAIRACRRSTVEGAESIVGLFINTVPVRVRVIRRRACCRGWRTCEPPGWPFARTSTRRWQTSRAGPACRAARRSLKPSSIFKTPRGTQRCARRVARGQAASSAFAANRTIRSPSMPVAAMRC